jgi:SAM-dependent methyltransferase
MCCPPTWARSIDSISSTTCCASRFALRGNYAAPLQQPAAILDVGGGTGRWAVELAAVFPQAQVTSLDLSNPSASGGALAGTVLPPNIQFQMANVLEGLPYPDASFDFVHQRLLVFALPLDRWPDDVRELVRVTRVGGRVELVEGRPAVHVQTPALTTLHQWVLDFCARRNIDPLVGNQIGSFLQRGGLADVTMREVQLPLGRWGGHLGTMAETDYFSGFSALRPILVAQGITTGEAFDEMMQAARRELDTGRYTWSYYIAYGQRSTR